MLVGHFSKAGMGLFWLAPKVLGQAAENRQKTPSEPRFPTLIARGLAHADQESNPGTVETQSIWKSLRPKKNEAGHRI